MDILQEDLALEKCLSYFQTLLILHKPFRYLNNLLGDHISWEHTFQSHNQSVAMQAYIERCKDYKVGNRKGNQMRGIDHKSEILLDHPNDTNSLAPNAPYYNSDEYCEEDPNDNHEFDFDNDMENPYLSQSIYGDLNAILNSTTIAETLITSLLHVVAITFCHMDLMTFQVRMKNLHDASHANPILQHFTTIFIESNMHLVTVEMIAATIAHMDWTPPPIISSPRIMYLSLKDVSIAFNLNQKQHSMFMLARHILLNSYDNPILIKPFWALLGGDVGIGKNRVISALLTLASNWQQPNFVMIVAQMGLVAINATFNFNFHGKPQNA
jgi:hypothetical protein